MLTSCRLANAGLANRWLDGRTRVLSLWMRGIAEVDRVTRALVGDAPALNRFNASARDCSMQQEAAALRKAKPSQAKRKEECVRPEYARSCCMCLEGLHRAQNNP
jgi:hypothetical protein